MAEVTLLVMTICAIPAVELLVPVSGAIPNTTTDLGSFLCETSMLKQAPKHEAFSLAPAVGVGLEAVLPLAIRSELALLCHAVGLRLWVTRKHQPGDHGQTGDCNPQMPICAIS